MTPTTSTTWNRCRPGASHFYFAASVFFFFLVAAAALFFGGGESRGLIYKPMYAEHCCCTRHVFDREAKNDRAMCAVHCCCAPRFFDREAKKVGRCTLDTAVRRFALVAEVQKRAVRYVGLSGGCRTMMFEGTSKGFKNSKNAFRGNKKRRDGFPQKKTRIDLNAKSGGRPDAERPLAPLFALCNQVIFS